MSKETETRDQIVAAAKRVYMRWGFRKTTMEDIAAEAGKGKATLYYYFKSKEEVFTSVLEQLANEYGVTMRNEIDKYDNVSDKLRRYMMLSYEIAKEDLSIFRFLRAEVKEDPKLMEIVRKELEKHNKKFIKEMFAFGKEHENFRSFTESEIDIIAEFISFALRTFIMYIIWEADIDNIDERLKIISDFVIKGLT